MQLPTRKTENWKYTINKLPEAYLDAFTGRGAEAPGCQEFESYIQQGRLVHPFLAFNLAGQHSEKVINFGAKEQNALVIDLEVSDQLDVEALRYRIVCSANAIADLTINYEGELSANVVFIIEVAQNAQLKLKLNQELSKESALISHFIIEQQQNSQVDIVQQDQGGKVVRHDFQVKLLGERAGFNARGLFWPKQDQHIDTQIYVEHVAKHCTSEQFYRGVIEGNGHGVFASRVKVAEGASKSVSSQLNNNLLLSPQAQVDTQPILEIYNDDVQCNHGATVGQLDDDALFYLQARGIPLIKAKALMLDAFVAEVING